MGTVYVMRDGILVDKKTAPPLHLHDEAVNVISDTMDLTRHMCDGKYYDSKSTFRSVTRANNCVEVGNETRALLAQATPKQLDRRQRRDDIARAINQVRNGEGVRVQNGRIIGGMPQD